MNLSEQERTQVIRTWLDEGSTELSPRVHDAVLREFPRRNQDGAFGSSRMRMTALAAVVAAASAVVVIVLLAGPRLLPDVVPGGVPPTHAPPTAALRPTPELIDRSYRDAGYIGLPPPGALPSDASRTALVETFLHPGGPPYRGAILLYADGRLIWNEYYHAGFSRSTGWLEQRLTLEGVEAVRALATRGPDGPGGEVIRRLDPVQLRDRLPDSAWADVTVRPYVPSDFAACLVVENWEDPFEASSRSLPEKLALLPAPAATLLRDRERAPSDSYDSSSDCLGMTTAEARRLDAALREAGLEQDESRNRYLLEYHVVIDSADPDGWRLGVWFEPILPDGTITCSSCG
jgi:hypothetical protein